MYTSRNFKSKKDLKTAVANGERVTYFQPGPFGGNEERDGILTFEGPHYPQPHKWYATCEVKDGRVISVK